MEDQGDHNDLDSLGNPVITLQEALDEYEELEKVSTAVLGASDPSNCSYVKGYLKRQALYACLTCNPKASPDFQPAGICLGCSYKCHDGHELVELYTKRNFRCDCGNKKFSDNPCALQKEKEPYNELNLYNQNFSGLYCSCHRPYPDPEESEQSTDPMIQCVVCEDWHHTQHAVPGISLNDYEDDDQSIELICGVCMAKAEFLCHYGSLRAKEIDKEKIQTNTVASSAADDKLEKDEGCVIAIAPDTIRNDVDDTNKTVQVNARESGLGVEDSTSQDSGISSLNETDGLSVYSLQNDDNTKAKDTTAVNECLRTKFQKIKLEAGKGTLWGNGWRKNLCQCTVCKEMYENLKVGFLLEEDDTIESYETVGKEKTDSEMMIAEESFNKKVDALGRVGQIELIAGYNDMKGALTEYLKDFATNGQVVQEKDILEFFANLRAAKRPRLDGTFKY